MLHLASIHLLFSLMISERLSRPDGEVAQPHTILFPADAIGMDLAPRLAYRLGSGLVTDCVDFAIRDGRCIFIKPVYGGKALAHLRVTTPVALATVRPIKSLPGSRALQPKADLIIVRENTEGLYRGVGYIDGDYHVNLRVFTKKGMEQILRFCFELARKEKRPKVTFTHKAHVLTYTDEPMRQLFYEMAREYPEVEAEDMTIDACAMQIIMKPERFSIIFEE